MLTSIKILKYINILIPQYIDTCQYIDTYQYIDTSQCIEMCQSNVSLPQIKLDALKLSVIRYGFHCFLGASYV